MSWCLFSGMSFILTEEIKKKLLTHWGRVLHIYVTNVGHHWFRYWLVTCLAPSHYLNQCWNIANCTRSNKLHWNLNQNSYIFIQENAFENVICKMAAILSRPYCVNSVVEALELPVCLFGPIHQFAFSRDLYAMAINNFIIESNQYYYKIFWLNQFLITLIAALKFVWFHTVISPPPLAQYFDKVSENLKFYPFWNRWVDMHAQVQDWVENNSMLQQTNLHCMCTYIHLIWAKLSKWYMIYILNIQVSVTYLSK